MSTTKYLFQDVALPLEDRVKDLVSRFTLDEKVQLMMQYQPEVRRLEVAPYKHGTEAAHGIAWLGEATVFPQNIGLSNTWNPCLMKRIGEVIGDEARVYYQRDKAKHGLTLWAPTVDMERDPRWGRTEEAYGEDPHLTGELTKALVQGMQGEDPFYLKTVATLKHFLGNNNEIDRGECSASIDPRNMFEYYLKAFEPAFVEGKAKSMMTAYNAINGTPALLHPYVQEIVKEAWNMDGFIVSDAGDVLGIVNDHKYYNSYAAALAATIKSGIDSITDDADVSCQAIYDALAQGLLQEEDLDKALQRTFSVRFRLGEFDPDDRNPYAHVPDSKLCAPEHAKLAYKAAQEQVVLLKNDGLLPLQRETFKKIAILGPLADEVHVDWYSGTPSYKVTPYEAIKEKVDQAETSLKRGNDYIKLRDATSGCYVGIAPTNEQLCLTEQEAFAETFERTDWGWGQHTLKSVTTGKFVTENQQLFATSAEARGWFVKEAFSFVTHDDGTETLQSWDGQSVTVSEDGSLVVVPEWTEQRFIVEVIEDGITAAVQAAKESEVAIVFVGNSPFINGKECVDREDIILPPKQEQLIREVYKANPKTVVVVVGSYPYAINWADEYVPAIIYSSHAGQELGHAIADVIYGEYNPSGRLSMTWYRSSDSLPDIMDYDIIKGKRTYQYFDGDVLYPFGHGLSYTNFTYSDLEVVTNSDVINVAVFIENSGSVTGDEVVQLYVRANESRVRRPLKTLKGFNKVSLLPGERKRVKFSIPVSDLAIWDVTQERYCVETSTYEVMIGRSATNIITTSTVHVQGEMIPARKRNEVVKAINYDQYENVTIEEWREGGYCVRTKPGGGWISFHNVDFGNDEMSSELALTIYPHTNSKIEVKLQQEGAIVGSYQVETKQQDQTIFISLAVISGEQNVFITVDGDMSIYSLKLLQNTK
ncbi:glycoside hydrolase family 3 protein [Halalkalibacter urbisdiaboli]|uniref:glycoside hydrolase family 3 protein n=1 Tax=Halalkalibacter urbisdiaboli TaxID=1960589 RepID=UPI001A97D964|nr:glycoside hydrolase family 3 protein [Halalkalibacter urbisdiaboli]